MFRLCRFAIGLLRFLMLASVTVSVAVAAEQLVPFFPSASEAARQGFVRVINHSDVAGDVQIDAFDDAGRWFGPVTLSIGAAATVHFNSDDLEGGNATKGLTGGVGSGTGDWRLALSSALDIEVLSYVRTADGFLTAMNNVAPAAGNRHRVVIFNPGSNRSQQSLLRLINSGATVAAVTIEGVDDAGKAPGGTVRVFIPGGASRTFTAQDLELGGSGLDGALGDGVGKWRLVVEADRSIMAMSLLSSPTQHLTNLSGAHLRSGVSPLDSPFLEPLAAGGDGPEMIIIEPGLFRMGCLSERECKDDELPVHDVTISHRLALSKHEITFADWDACVADGGCNGYRPDDEGWGRGERPVIHVSWYDARSYVTWLSRSTGATYRLPSEAEWEYAARAGSETSYSWGDEIGRNRTNCVNDICGDSFATTAPVGSFAANAWGFHDMHGNVYEWVQDCWNGSSYRGAPSDGSSWVDGVCGLRVLRGGAWTSNLQNVRAANRVRDAIETRADSFGFRVARTLATVEPANVPMFPSASDGGLQGFVRVINHSSESGEIRIDVFDDAGEAFGPLTLSIEAGASVHFNSNDLEEGNAAKGLSGGVGSGTGDWRLRLSSALEIELLAYIRTPDGFLTAMSDVAPTAGNRHRVAILNPGSNRRQESRLRLINPGMDITEVTIEGVDDSGESPGSTVRVSIPAGASRTFTAELLETGGSGLEGALGNGDGKWRLAIESDRSIMAMSLLASPTQHLTNLSTAPQRGMSAELFGTWISERIVQSKCANCHVEGGESGHSRLVFESTANPDHQAANRLVIQRFLSEVEGGANLLLDKVRGIDHGGGTLLDAGSQQFTRLALFVSLLDEELSMIREPVERVRSRYRVNVSVFGEGNVQSNTDEPMACVNRVCSLVVDHGAPVTFQAEPFPGWKFERWRNCDTTSGLSCTVYVYGNMLLDAAFVSSEPPRFSAQVIELSDTKIEQIEDYNEATGTIIFSADFDHSELVPGTVVISKGKFVGSNDPANIPIYFARRVKQIVAQQGSVVIVDTNEVSLEEVVEEGTIILSQGPLPASAIDASSLPSGIEIDYDRLHRRAQAGDSSAHKGPNRRLSKSALVNPLSAKKNVIPLTVDVQIADRVSVRGELDISVDPDVVIHFSLLEGVTEFRSLFRVSGRSDLQLAIGEEIKIVEQKYPLGGPIRFDRIVRGPIVFIPELQLYLTVDVDIDVQLTPSISMTADIEGGAHFLKSTGWRAIRSAHAGADVKLGLEAVNARIGVEVGPELGLGVLIYGLLGPQVSANAFAGFEAWPVLPITESCSFDYRTYLGLAGKFSGEFKLFSKRLSYDAELFRLVRNIDRASGERQHSTVELRKPTDLQALPTSPYEIALSWSYEGETDGMCGSVDFNVFRDTELIASGLGDASFADTDLSPDTEYCYYVIASNEEGEDSERSSARCAMTLVVDTMSPHQPLGLVAEPLSSTAISLDWDDLDDEVVFVVHGGRSGEDLYPLEQVADSHANIVGLLPDVEYCFEVTAVDAAGNESVASSLRCNITLNSAQAEWTVFMGCQEREYRIEEKMDLDINYSATVSVVGEGQDYDGDNLAYALSGAYDSASGLLDGQIIWIFEDNPRRRLDTFEVDLTDGDTGDVDMTQVERTGCEALIRFVRDDAQPTAVIRSPTARSNRGQFMQ